MDPEGCGDVDLRWTRRPGAEMDPEAGAPETWEGPRRHEARRLAWRAPGRDTIVA